MAGLDTAELEREGWAIVDLLTPTQVEAARQVIDDLGLPERHEFFATPAQAWGDVAFAVDAELKAIAAEQLSAMLPGHRPFLAGTTSKGAHDGAPIKFHQDWTYTDEERTRPVFFWCPLVDCDQHNGGMLVVPASNHWPRHLRPSRNHEPSEQLQEELAARAVPVTLRSGQALAFDPATFHGSVPNRSSTRRPAFTIAVVANGAELVHYHESDDGRLEGFIVDDTFFTTNPYRTRPNGYPTFEPAGRSLREDDLRTALGLGTAR